MRELFFLKHLKIFLKSSVRKCIMHSDGCGDVVVFFFDGAHLFNVCV